MGLLVVYDSTYGNTEKIAKTAGDSVGAKVIRTSDVNASDLNAVDLIIVGSPTLGGRPTLTVQTFLVKYLARFKGMDVAAFDTRLPAKWVRVFGYAANKISDGLKKSGGNPVVPPAGFFVKGREGPLKDGEIERAAVWAKAIAENRKAG
jgi:flavodoxin